MKFLGDFQDLPENKEEFKGTEGKEEVVDYLEGGTANAIPVSL